ncbi:hypothetical protein [Streptomyces sp. NPDC059788]|uniref:hypothetical protein n=1 Tax=Streptomyces sp. NPDC059788 TaxID=3346948 RepID=UPI00365D5AF4
MATHRTATALVSAATVGTLALGAVGSASAAEEPKPPVRNQSVIVDDIGRLADASAELADKAADSRGHSVQVRAARTHLDTVLADAQRLADVLNKDSDRSVSADTVQLRRVSQQLRTQVDELSERRAPAPGESSDAVSVVGSVSRSVTDIFKILGLDKLLGDLRQQPGAQPAEQPAAPATNRPAQPAAQPAAAPADDQPAEQPAEQPAAQPKAPISDPQPTADTAPQPADTRQEQPADAPQRQGAEQPQRQGAGALLNSVLSLPTVLVKALGL